MNPWEEDYSKPKNPWEEDYSNVTPSSPSRPSFGLGGIQATPPQPDPYGDALEGGNTNLGLAGRAAMRPVKFVGDVATLLPAWGNAVAQGVQDRAPMQIPGNLVKATAAPVANLIGRPFQRPIQSTVTSLERAGVSNEKKAYKENVPGFLIKEWARTGSNGYKPEDAVGIEDNKVYQKDAVSSGLADDLAFAAENFSPIPSAGLVKPLGRLADVGATAGRKYAIKGLGQLERAANITNKYAGKLASEMSSVSEEALRMRGTKEGRKALEANAGKEDEIGQKLVDMMNDHETYSPNKQKIDNAISGMGKVDLTPIVKALEDSKIKSPSGKLYPYEEKANAAIQMDIDALKGQDGNMIVDASEALSLRKRMDRTIDHNSQEFNVLNNAKKKGRAAFKNILIEKAKESGKPEYIEGMQDWAKQLDAKDRLEHFLGKNKETQQDRAEAFIHNLWGKNKKNRQKVMADIGEIFGSDFVNESKLAHLSAQLGTEGIPAWFSRSSTGRSRLGGIPFLPFSSPKIASRITLPLAEFPPKSIGFFKKLLIEKSEAKQTAIANALNKMGVTDEDINKGITHIIKQAEAEPEPLKFGPPTPEAPAKPDPMDDLFGPSRYNPNEPARDGSIEDLAPPELAARKAEEAQRAVYEFNRQGRERALGLNQKPSQAAQGPELKILERPIKKPPTQDELFSPEDIDRRRRLMFNYLKDKTGIDPFMSQIDKNLHLLGRREVPKIPIKPKEKPPEVEKIRRKYNGRRNARELTDIASLMHHGHDSWPTTTIRAEDAPKKFWLGGEEYTKGRTLYGKTRFVDYRGRAHLFSNDELIHMDPPEEAVPF